MLGTSVGSDTLDSTSVLSDSVVSVSAAAGTVGLARKSRPSITLRILVGVSGKSMAMSPNGDKASATAFKTVGVPTIAPPSPTPRIPPTDWDGVLLCTNSNTGTSLIAGK